MTTLESPTETATRNADARNRLMSLINANWTTQAVSVAAQLRLPEMLCDGPRSANELAQAAHCHAPSLTRLLRALTSIGVLTELDDERFELTSLGAFLRADVAGSLAAWAEFCGTRSWSAWGCLLDSVRTGKSIRKRASGADGFDHLHNDAQGAMLFNRAMVDLTQPIALAVARNLNFSGMDLIVDVGGGYGELLASILHEHSSMRGILFDLAHATVAVSARLAAAGVEDRFKLVTGSFFDAVPDGGDGYFLKSVLHDWDDDLALQILKNCRRAMARDAKLFVIERIAPHHFRVSPNDQGIARSDLNMLISTGGCERSESQYRKLLAAARLRVTHIVELDGPYCVIETQPF